MLERRFPAVDAFWFLDLAFSKEFSQIKSSYYPMFLVNNQTDSYAYGVEIKSCKFNFEFMRLM